MILTPETAVAASLAASVSELKRTGLNGEVGSEDESRKRRDVVASAIDG